jgi:hypothetical protein
VKKVFKIETEEKEDKLIKLKDEYNIFAKDMESAIKRVGEVMVDKMQIIRAELLCEVEEEKDLIKSMEE